jgi:hypothetical protein
MTPYPLPSPAKLCQATTKLPSASTAAEGADWLPVVVVFTWNSPPRGAPFAAYRWP